MRMTCRYPPNDNRKYMLVFWDHGNGWLGYGADGKCSPTGSYSDNVYCDVASLAAITQGEALGPRHAGAAWWAANDDATSQLHTSYQQSPQPAAAQCMAPRIAFSTSHMQAAHHARQPHMSRPCKTAMAHHMHANWCFLLPDGNLGPCQGPASAAAESWGSLMHAGTLAIRMPHSRQSCSGKKLSLWLWLSWCNRPPGGADRPPHRAAVEAGPHRL